MSWLDKLSAGGSAEVSVNPSVTRSGYRWVDGSADRRTPLRLFVVHHYGMGKVKEFEFEKPAPAVEDEDEEPLAAIDEGIRDADADRTVPAVQKIHVKSRGMEIAW